MITDPLGQGFVGTLAHPGGNMTGFSDYDPPIAGKWVELLKQIKPTIARVALLYNPASTLSPISFYRPSNTPLSSDGAVLGLPRRRRYRRFDKACRRWTWRRAGDAGSVHNGASRCHRRRCGPASGAGGLSG